DQVVKRRPGRGINADQRRGAYIFTALIVVLIVVVFLVKQISNQAHEPCRDQRSGGSETLIAPQLLGQSQMTDYAKADGSNRWPKECARGSVEHQVSENHWKVWPNSNSECGDSNHDGAERCENPLRADCIQQFATRHKGKQAGETARGKDEADILLSPFLLSQINGYIGTETSQHGRIEKIDSVKTVQARTRWRGFTSMGQRHNKCHLLTVLSNQGIDGKRTERHGLFRCGAFAAARLRAHRSKIFGSGIPITSPRARTPGRL